MIIIIFFIILKYTIILLCNIATDILTMMTMMYYVYCNMLTTLS